MKVSPSILTCDFAHMADAVKLCEQSGADMLHLDVMTVTGKTLGENLEDLKRNGYYDRCDSLCAAVGLTWQDIKEIRKVYDELS